MIILVMRKASFIVTQMQNHAYMWKNLHWNIRFTFYITDIKLVITGKQKKTRQKSIYLRQQWKIRWKTWNINGWCGIIMIRRSHNDTVNSYETWRHNNTVNHTKRVLTIIHCISDVVYELYISIVIKLNVFLSIKK